MIWQGKLAPSSGRLQLQKLVNSSIQSPFCYGLQSLHTSSIDKHRHQASCVHISLVPRLSSYSRLFSNTSYIMAPSVLGMGVSAQHSSVPEERRAALSAILDKMNADMAASPYEWDMFYVDADMDFNDVIKKLHEKDWDCVMLGVGLRTGPSLTVFFEKLINAVHKELPKTKIAFSVTIDAAKDACDRALAL